MSSDSIAPGDLPYLTADLPGIGGVIKRYDEDFLVEEIPLYPASGQGTHLYLLMEKRGLTTPAAIREIAGELGRDPRDFGYAGLKDAHGVTRQMVSIEHVDPQRVASLSFRRIRILSVDRHTNKVKLGHLSGNRFDLRIRDTIQAPLEIGRAIVDRLASRGAANYFGPQRFGVRGDNAEVGRAVIGGDYGRAIDIHASANRRTSIVGRPEKRVNCSRRATLAAPPTPGRGSSRNRHACVGPLRSSTATPRKHGGRSIAACGRSMFPPFRAICSIAWWRGAWTQ